MTILFIALLIGAVVAAVHYAEVIAHKLGEPYGTLVLAVSVTVIEVALIIAMMLSGSDGSAFIARDAVFAAIMIVVNFIVGLCIFIGGINHKELDFRSEGPNTAIAVLAGLATLSLILPVFTISSTGPSFTTSQLAFAGISSLLLYGSFIFFQTVTHRDYFLPHQPASQSDEAIHAEPPSLGKTLLSAVFLLISLVAVVALAKILSPSIEAGVKALGAPKTIVGIAIAALVLMPESIAALRAARANRLQTSLNLALGSALASIGLTIPAVAIISIYFGLPLSLGISPVNIVLLVLTLFVGLITLFTGKTSILQGIVHLIIFFTYLFTSLIP
jgi:Ca2+:H+ antiporter